MAEMEDLVERFARGELSMLERRFERALRDNEAGGALLRRALCDAVWAGYEGWADLAVPATDPVTVDTAVLWKRWQAQKALTPEAERWSERLGEAGAGAVVVEAQQRLLAVGEELGMTGAVGGRRARAALGDAGRQAAEAGAALWVAQHEEPVPEQPVVARAGRMLGTTVTGDAVHVATATNRAECDLLQGVLAEAGIPSTWRSSGGDVVDYIASGYRDVLVPPSAFEEARVLLATVDSPVDHREEEPMRRVGLERPARRRFGKASALLFLTGGVAALLAAVSALAQAWGLAALIAYVALIAAAVAWSDRAESRRMGIR